MAVKEAPGEPKAPREAVQCMRVNPLLRFKGEIHEGLGVVETEGRAVAPGTGLIFERSRKGRGEDRSVLADILPDRRLDVVTSQRGGRSAQILEETRGRGRIRQSEKITQEEQGNKW